MDVDVAPVIIDLGYDRGEPPTYRSPGRPTVSRWFPVSLVAALVLIFATASAAPARPPLTPLFRLPVGPADGYALTPTGDLLAQSEGWLGSYDLTTGRTLWQVAESAPSYRLNTVDGLVLVRPPVIGDGPPGTTAVSAATGDGRWQRSGNVLTMPGSTTMLAITGVQNYFGTGRRVRGVINAIDPATGATQWSVVVPESAILLSVPGPGDEGARMLLARDDQTVTLYDMDDGRPLATGRLPGADLGPDNPIVAGGYLLVRQPGTAGAEISAYDPQTFQPVWTAPTDASSQVETCGDIACVIGDDGLRGLDPATGAVLWTRPDWQSIEQQGQVFVAYGGQSGSTPLGVVDPDRGTMRVPLNGWRPIAGSAGVDQLLVTRADDTASRTMVAVARTGDTQPRVLAELPDGTADCQAAPDRLACRSVDGELMVWAYASKG